MASRQLTAGRRREPLVSDRLLIVMALALLFSTAGCFERSAQKGPPTPKGAKRPVRQGALVQLKAALDYLEMVEMSQAEEVDNLPALCHAIAAFYGWRDPAETMEEMARFLRRFCRKRLDEEGCATLQEAMGASRRALLEDLIWVANQYLEAGAKWAGKHSMEALAKDFKHKRSRLDQRLTALDRRWPVEAIPKVETCRVTTPRAVVLEARKDGARVNGVAVTRLKKGMLPSAAEVIEGLQSLLVAGAQSASAKRTAGASPRQIKPRSDRVYGKMILRVDPALPFETVRGLLEVAGAVNLRNVYLRAQAEKPWPVPCILQLRVWPRVNRPSGEPVVIDGKGASVGGRKGGPARRLDLAKSADRAKLREEVASGDYFVAATSKATTSAVIEAVEILAGRRGRRRVRVWLGMPSRAGASERGEGQ